MVERIKHVTMKDIARRANVSQPAVSYALNNKKGLDDETRQRILDIATEMGYRPNLLMKGLRKGKSMSIGLMIQCDSDYFGRICFGAQQRLAQDGYVSILGYANEDNQLEEIYNLIDRRVDGIILFPSNPDAVSSGQGLEEIMDRRIPMVTVDTVIEGANEIDFVGTDDYVGGRLAAEHLLSLGHRTLAFWYPDSLDEKPTGSPIFERLKGFRDVVEESGAEFVLSMNNTAASLLNASPRPTCVFVCNDMVVPLFYRAAATLRVRIPQDLSVVGFGDCEIARFLSPPLTTVMQNPGELGHRAAEMLLNRMSGKNKSEGTIHLRIKPELVVRESAISIAT